MDFSRVGAIRERFLPRTVVLRLPDAGRRGAIEAFAPFLAAINVPASGAVAYLCEDSSCRAPIDDAAALAAALAGHERKDDR